MSPKGCRLDAPHDTTRVDARHRRVSHQERLSRSKSILTPSSARPIPVLTTLTEAALEQVRVEYNTVRLRAGIGYVTPHDEHQGKGEVIRRLRQEGLRAAQAARIVYRRNNKQNRSRSGRALPPRVRH